MASPALTSPWHSRKRLGDLFSRLKDSSPSPSAAAASSAASPSPSPTPTPSPSSAASPSSAVSPTSYTIPTPLPAPAPPPLRCRGSYPQLQQKPPLQKASNQPAVPPHQLLPLPTVTISSDREDIAPPDNERKSFTLQFRFDSSALPNRQKTVFDDDSCAIDSDMSSRSEREPELPTPGASNPPLRTPGGSIGQKTLANSSKWRAAISDQKIRRELDLAIELSEFEKARALVDKRPKVLSVPNEENLLPADVALLLHRWELYEWFRSEGGELSYDLLCDYGHLLEHLREATEQVNLQILQLTAKIFGDNDAQQREPARGFEKELSLIEKRNRRLKHMIAKLNALPPTPPPAHLHAEVISNSALRVRLHAEPDSELIRVVGRPAGYVPLLGFRVECAEDDCFAAIARQMCEHCAGCEGVFTRVLRGLVHGKRYYIRAQLLGLRGWSESAYLSAPHFVTITGWADARRISANGCGGGSERQHRTSASLLDFSAVKIKHIADTSFNNFTVELNSCFVPRAGGSHERETRERERPLASKAKSPGIERRALLTAVKRSRSPPFSASGQFQQLFNLINVISTGDARSASCRSDSKSPLVAWLASNPFKFTKLTKPGVYLCPIFYQDPRIACTADESLPLVLLDENQLSLNLSAEMGALQKLVGDMGSLRFVLKSVNRMNCPPSIEFRLKVLNTIAELTSSLDASSPAVGGGGGADSQSRAFSDTTHPYTLALYGQVFEGAMGARESCSVLVCCICARPAATPSNHNEEQSNNEPAAAATAAAATATAAAQTASAPLPAGLHWVAYTKFLKKRHRNGVLQLHSGVAGCASPTPGERLLPPPNLCKSRQSSSCSSREGSGRLSQSASFDESSVSASSCDSMVQSSNNSSNSSIGAPVAMTTRAAIRSIDAPAARSGAAAVGEAYEQLVRALEDVIVFTRGLSEPLSAGLYVAYLQMHSTLEQIRLLVPRHQPHMLPAIKVRENPHVNADEWLLLHDLSRTQNRRSFREKLSTGQPVPVRPRSSPDNRDDPDASNGRSVDSTNAHPNLPAPLIKFRKELLQGIMKLLEYVKEDACDSDAATGEHFVYLNEVIELDAQVSLILVVPSRDEICTMDERVSGGGGGVGGGPQALSSAQPQPQPQVGPIGAVRQPRAHKKSLQVPASSQALIQAQQAVVAYASDSRSTSGPNASARLCGSLSVCEEKTHLMQVYVASFELIMTALYESAAVRKCVALLNTVEFAAQILAHMQRGFLATADIQEMRARLRRLATMQERLEEVWRVKRWLPELIARARDKHGKEQLLLLPVNCLRTERHSSPLGRSVRRSTASVASNQFVRTSAGELQSGTSVQLPQREHETPAATAATEVTSPLENVDFTSAEAEGTGGVSNESLLAPPREHQISETATESEDAAAAADSRSLQRISSPPHTCPLQQQQPDYNYDIDVSTPRRTSQIMCPPHPQDVHVLKQPDKLLVEPVSAAAAKRSDSLSPSSSDSASASPSPSLEAAVPEATDAASAAEAEASAAAGAAHAPRAAGATAANRCSSDLGARNLDACVNNSAETSPQPRRECSFPTPAAHSSASVSASASACAAGFSTSAICTATDNATSPAAYDSPIQETTELEFELELEFSAGASSGDIRNAAASGSSVETDTCGADATSSSTCSVDFSANAPSDAAATDTQVTRPQSARTTPSPHPAECSSSSTSSLAHATNSQRSFRSERQECNNTGSTVAGVREGRTSTSAMPPASASSSAATGAPQDESGGGNNSNSGTRFLKHASSHRSSRAVSPLPRLLSRHSQSQTHYRSHQLIGSRSESGGESDSSSDFGSFVRAESLHDDS